MHYWSSERMRSIIVFGLVLTGIVLSTILAGRPSTHNQDDAARIREGRELYVRYCAGCHGVNLEGQPDWRKPLPNGTMPAPPHDASGHTWHHPDSFLFQITKEGGQSVAPQGYISGMPAFGGQLTDNEIWVVLEYIKSMWPSDIRAAQETLNRRSP
ncbi:c-type cytochrome [Roseiflexus sp.]|uniref:c-type cytochrome n=1 Tax=Roseiflexus sp. TaxID=2562120 RepID=UPI00398A7D4B